MTHTRPLRLSDDYFSPFLLVGLKAVLSCVDSFLGHASFCVTHAVPLVRI
jgi:hypothetical protein